MARQVPSLPPSANQSVDLSRLLVVLTAVIVTAALSLARDVIIPIALAVLITFVLAPLVNALRRIGIPRVLAVIVVVGLGCGAILSIGAFATSEVSKLAAALPDYELHIRDKIHVLRGSTAGSGTVTRATAAITHIGEELSGNAPPPAGGMSAPPGRSSAAPIAVQMQSPSSDPFAVVSAYLTAIFSPLASTALVVLFVIFFLLQLEDLRDRIIRLLGTREIHRTTEAMQDAAAGLSKYLLLQTLLNGLTGLLIGLGLWAIGVPSPWLWGILTMLLRFVPYIGTIIAGIIPVALAAAVDPGWSLVTWTLILFTGVEGTMGQIVEPQVYGRQTGLSPLAIMIAATFWTWLWGPVGLILATPLTMCLVIVGQYTQRLEFLSVLLGDQPALTPAESFYQRLIAGDPAEIIDQAAGQLKTVSLADYYDTVAIPGLALAERDITSGELPPERQGFLVDGVRELIDDLSDHVDIGTDAKPPVAKSSTPGPTELVCIAGHGSADEAANLLLVQLLKRLGVDAEPLSEPGLAGLVTLKDKYPAAALICVSFAGAARSTQVRLMVRRIRRVLPNAKVLVGLWQLPSGDLEFKSIKENSGADWLATSLGKAVELCLTQVEAIASHSAPRPATEVEALQTAVTAPGTGPPDNSLVPQGV